jgi:hypothetical protein
MLRLDKDGTDEFLRTCAARKRAHAFLLPLRNLTLDSAWAVITIFPLGGGPFEWRASMCRKGLNRTGTQILTRTATSITSRKLCPSAPDTINWARTHIATAAFGFISITRGTTMLFDNEPLALSILCAITTEFGACRPSSPSIPHAIDGAIFCRTWDLPFQTSLTRLSAILCLHRERPDLLE